jgi:hypothetical protein
MNVFAGAVSTLMIAKSNFLRNGRARWPSAQERGTLGHAISFALAARLNSALFFL